MIVEFFALGIPQPQGSTRAFVRRRRRTGRLYAAVTSDNARLKPWREAMSWAAARARRAAGLDGPATGPVCVAATFWLPAPARLRVKVRRGVEVACITKPDVDKLLRGLLDALSGVVYADDSQVVAAYAQKRYTVAAAGVSVRVGMGHAGGEAPELLVPAMLTCRAIEALPPDSGDGSPGPGDGR